jgi:hypothetical protein
MRFSGILFALSLAIATVSAGVVDRRVAAMPQNERDGAQELNQQCMTGTTTCINGQIAQCSGEKFVLSRYVLVIQ